MNLRDAVRASSNATLPHSSTLLADSLGQDPNLRTHPHSKDGSAGTFRWLLLHLPQQAVSTDSPNQPNIRLLRCRWQSSGSLWHSIVAEEPCNCGNGARLGFTHHRAHFQVFAHRIDLCGGRSLRSVAMDLIRLHACVCLSVCVSIG